jgi:hypothetical protein
MDSTRELKVTLKRLPREDLVKIASDYVGFENEYGKGCDLKISEIPSQSDEQLKFIFKRDCPNNRW